MTVNEWADRIGAWHRATFPWARLPHVMAKLEEERHEAEVAWSGGIVAATADELADCLICVLAAMAREGIDPELALASSSTRVVAKYAAQEPDCHCDRLRRVPRAQGAARRAAASSPIWMPDFLFAFQRSSSSGRSARARRDLRRLRPRQDADAAGVGRERPARHTGKPVLIVTPLAVSLQTDARGGEVRHRGGRLARRPDRRRRHHDHELRAAALLRPGRLRRRGVRRVERDQELRRRAPGSW